MAAQSVFRYFLAGIDEGGHADDAVVAAASLSRFVGGVLEVLHTRPPNADDEVRATSNAAQKMRAHLGELAAASGLPPEGLVEALRVYVGEPGEVLSRRAVEWPADVVFLGPHARRGIIDLGSTAASILENTNSCVWVQPVPFTEIKRVLVATDLSETSVEPLRIGHRIAGRLGGNMTVLACGADTQAVNDEVQLRLQDSVWPEVDVDIVVADERPVEGILAWQGMADVIVLGTRGRTGIGKALLGSVSAGVLRRAQTSVLVVPEPNR